MIKITNGKINPSCLSFDGGLNERMLNNYNYIKCKNEFEEIIDTLQMNQLVQTMYRELLKYSVDENLEFIVVCNDPRFNKEDTEIFTMDREIYDNSLDACKELLHKFKSSWKNLSEVERFILKSLYIDDDKLTDEEIIDELLTYKNKYQLCKKSAYVKMDSSMKPNNIITDKNIEKAMFDTMRLITITENKDAWDKSKKSDFIINREK